MVKFTIWMKVFLVLGILTLGAALFFANVLTMYGDKISKNQTLTSEESNTYYSALSTFPSLICASVFWFVFLGWKILSKM